MRRFVALSIILLTLLPLNRVFSEYGDVVMDKNKEIMAQVGLNPVLFPHWIHRINYKCKACHEDIFGMRKGGTNATMAAIMKGEFCGKCHNGKISWDLLYCDRCHSEAGKQ